MRFNQWLSAVVLLGAGPLGIGCGADDAGTASDAATSFDGTAGQDINTPDTAGTTAATDASPQDTVAPVDTLDEVRADTDAPLVALKEDDTFLVPGNISEKTEVAAFGTRFAWVEQGDAGPFFVVWDVATDSGFEVFDVPNLVRPRELALTPGALFYVDERYGDEDVFGVALASGEAFAVVTRPGAQRFPAATPVGGVVRVAWQDCRACVTGDDGGASEIYSKEVDPTDPIAGSETRVTDDAVADLHPSFGIEQGAVLAWVHGRSELVLEALVGGARRTYDVAGELGASEAIGWLAVKPGVLAWRTRPLIVNPDSMIVNPDSMYPTDVAVSDIVGLGLGTTTRLTTHGELRHGHQPKLTVAGDRLAWLESSPAIDRLRVVDGLVPLESREIAGVHDVALGQGFVAIIAPRSDNDDLDDLWVLPITE